MEISIGDVLILLLIGLSVFYLGFWFVIKIFFIGIFLITTIVLFLIGLFLLLGWLFR